MHVITLLLIEWEFILIINCTWYSVTYIGTRPLNKGTNRPITLCTVKLFIQLMYNKNDHLAKWSIFCQIFDVFFRMKGMKGTYILNILVLLLFENLQRIY